MPRGSKAKYTDKQKRQAEDIAEGYVKRGVPEKVAKARGWATVNAMSGGGKKSGSGRGKKESHASSRKGGKSGALVITVGLAFLYYMGLMSLMRLFGTRLETIPAGIPYLAPEIQLLYKSGARQLKDEADFRAVVPPNMPIDVDQSQRLYINQVGGSRAGMLLASNNGNDDSMKVYVVPQILTPKTVVPSTQVVGLPVTYTLTISNSGPTISRVVMYSRAILRAHLRGLVRVHDVVADGESRKHEGRTRLEETVTEVQIFKPPA